MNKTKMKLKVQEYSPNLKAMTGGAEENPKDSKDFSLKMSEMDLD